MEKLRWRAFLTLTGETSTDQKTAMTEEFEDFFETLRGTGVDCKAIVLLGPARAIGQEKKRQRLTSTIPKSRLKMTREIPGGN